MAQIAVSTKTPASTELGDAVTNELGFIDTTRNLRVGTPKRIVGSTFGASIDTTYLYTTSVAGTGSVTATEGVGTLATGTTANSTASIVTKAKVRYLAGRTNIFRAQMRFGDTGTANNVREFGLQVDANNGFYFRLSGTTFSIVTRKGGVDTVVNSGSFNGNGSGSGGTYAVDTNFDGFEIIYLVSKIVFVINDVAIHTVKATNTSLSSSVVGVLYASNANSGGGTSNVSLNILAWSISQIGDAINNPLYYHINAVAETRTLKSGGGTLQSIAVGRSGGANATLTLYDSTSGSGTIIGIWDLNNVSSVGTHVLGPAGVNFYNGLTYVTAGTMTAASVTILWE